ncbi:MAG: phosphate/phosphite/phosphonate ABC transporter substrate-binding protein [Alphaproteobacteria bacterium]
MKLCTFPMYDWPELKSANDALWHETRALLSNLGIASSEDLARDVDASDLMNSENLLFTQTCGLPLVTELAGKVQAFAAPWYEVEGGGNGTYSSAIIVRKSDPALTLPASVGYRLAFNGPGSQSGYSALRYHLQASGIAEHHFSSETKSGGHRQTVVAVASGNADIGAIDSLCWDLAKQIEPEAVANLRVLTWTKSNPAMPYVCNKRSNLSHAQLCDVLSRAIQNLPDQTRKLLRLKGIKPCDDGFFATVKDQYEVCKHFQMV